MEIMHFAPQSSAPAAPVVIPPNPFHQMPGAPTELADPAASMVSNYPPPTKAYSADPLQLTAAEDQPNNHVMGDVIAAPTSSYLPQYEQATGNWSSMYGIAPSSTPSADYYRYGYPQLRTAYDAAAGTYQMPAEPYESVGVGRTTRTATGTDLSSGIDLSGHLNSGVGQPVARVTVKPPRTAVKPSKKVRTASPRE